MKKQNFHIPYFALLAVGLLIAACSPAPTSPAAPTTQAAAVTAESNAAPTTRSAAVTAEYDSITAEPPTPVDITGPTPAPSVEVEPIEVTTFTPAQGEGPYYPVNKPADRDSDLVELAGAAALPAGEILQLSGVVYGAGGLPLEGAVIEIWQTDQSGIYDHPGDPNTAQHDPNFQFYGEALTGADGVYSFRTILPGLYEPRPRHIHVKVRFDGAELLTTQFYFAGEVTASGPDSLLLVQIAPAEDDAGNPIWVGQRDLFLQIDQ